MIAQVLLQAHPGRGHFRHGGKSQRRQVRELERGAMSPADQIERIACDHFAKAGERGGSLLVARLHDAHRPAPGDVDRAVEQAGHAIAGNRRIDQFDIDAFAVVISKRLGGVERRIEYGAKVFRELDRHGDLFQSALMPLAFIGAAHFSISLSTNFCR